MAGISPGGDYAELLARAVAAVIAGDQALAEGEFAPIAGLTGKPAQSERLPTLSLSGWPTATHPPTRNPPKRDLAAGVRPRQLQEVENLATACYRCQDQKSNRRLSELGWELRRPGGMG